MSSGKFVAFFVILGALLVVDLVQAKLKPLNPEQPCSETEMTCKVEIQSKQVLKPGESIKPISFQINDVKCVDGKCMIDMEGPES